MSGSRARGRTRAQPPVRRGVSAHRAKARPFFASRRRPLSWAALGSFASSPTCAGFPPRSPPLQALEVRLHRGHDLYRVRSPASRRPLAPRERLQGTNVRRTCTNGQERPRLAREALARSGARDWDHERLFWCVRSFLLCVRALVGQLRTHLRLRRPRRERAFHRSGARSAAPRGLLGLGACPGRRDGGGSASTLRQRAPRGRGAGWPNCGAGPAARA